MAQLTCPKKKGGGGGGDGFSFLPFDFRLSNDGEVTTASLVLAKRHLYCTTAVVCKSAQAWNLVSTMLATDTLTFPGPKVATATDHYHKKAFRVFASSYCLLKAWHL